MLELTREERSWKDGLEILEGVERKGGIVRFEWTEKKVGGLRGDEGGFGEGE